MSRLSKAREEKGDMHFNIKPSTTLTYMEYLIASIAVSEGKKSSTATSLFSFFLSVQINFVKAEYSNLNLKL